MANAPHERALALNLSSVEAETLRDRLIARATRTADGCLEWNGARSESGYGRISVKNHVILAHRAALLAETGELRPGELVLHSCDNPPCIEPSHVRAGTPSDNMVDRGERGSFPELVVRGSRNGMSKLTEDEVREIRRRVAAGQTRAQVGRDFACSRQTASDIVAGRLWAHLI